MINIIAILAGYAFALVGGYFCVGIVVKLLGKLDRNPPRPTPPQGSDLLGLVERALFLTALLIGREGFVVVWLAMKVATDWKLERQRGRPPKLAYNTFLIGTGLSLGFAVAGAMIVQWGQADDRWLWWNSLYLVIATLLAVEAMRQILLRRLRPNPPAGVASQPLVAQQAEPVNAYFAQPPTDGEGEGPGESLANTGKRMDGPFGKIDLSATLRAAGEEDQFEDPAPAGSGADELPDVEGVEIVPQRNGRRTPEEIAQLTDSVVVFLRENPWRGVNEIADAMGMENKDLRRPLHVLLTNRKIRKRGQGRTTEYRTGAVRKRKTKKKAARRARKR